MSPAWHRLMHELDEVQPAAPTRAPWLLVTFTVPEERRDERHQLRTLLARQGFGSLGGGLWLGTARKEPQVRLLLRDLGLNQYVELFAADHLGPGESADISRRCWDIDRLAADYTDLLKTARAHRSRVTSDHREAFVQLVSTAQRWRQLRELDPALPQEALPADWPAVAVRTEVQQLIARLLPAASIFVNAEAHETPSPLEAL